MKTYKKRKGKFLDKYQVLKHTDELTSRHGSNKEIEEYTDMMVPSSQELLRFIKIEVKLKLILMHANLPRCLNMNVGWVSKI